MQIQWSRWWVGWARWKKCGSGQCLLPHPRPLPDQQSVLHACHPRCQSPQYLRLLRPLPLLPCRRWHGLLPIPERCWSSDFFPERGGWYKRRNRNCSRLEPLRRFGCGHWWKRRFRSSWLRWSRRPAPWFLVPSQSHPVIRAIGIFRQRLGRHLRLQSLRFR